MATDKNLAVTRINGNEMINYVQNKKFVCLIGMAGDANPDGRSFKLTTLDGVAIIVKMTNVIEEHIAGYVELEGKVLGKACFDCHTYGLMKDLCGEPDKPIDQAVFAEAIELTNKNPRDYITSAGSDALPA